MLLQAFAILAMLGILSILIIVHEFGHFSVAKLFGFQTPVFGFGLPFGPYKVVGHKWDTEFRVYACLLGGFVAIPELGDESNAREENYGVPLQPYRKFPIWQRALVAFAGVGFNILFAWLLYFLILTTMGVPAQSVTVGGLPAEPHIATEAGVKKWDRITAVDSQPVETTDDIINYLGSRPNTQVVLHIARPTDTKALEDGKESPTQPVELTMTTNKNGKVGMELEGGPVHYKPATGNPIEIAGLAWQKLWKLTANMAQALGLLVQGIFTPAPATHVPGTPPHLGLKDLHGPLAVISIGASIAQQDWSQLLIFTIYISMDLALINLFPWPALDGFHLATMLVEGVRGKPMEERAHTEIVKWGFISLLVLMAVIMVNDVTALMHGDLNIKLRGHGQKQQTSGPGDKTSTDGTSESQPAPGTGTSAPAPEGAK
ncbi:MAG TPA: M50 family metallopeptidase [Candidatus Obscuribacterales bacterium]